MGRTVQAKPEGDKGRNYEQQGYGTEVVLDQICHLHQQSTKLNEQMRSLTEISRNMLEVQMEQKQVLDRVNKSLDRLENVEQSLTRLEPIQNSIESSTTKIKELEDTMSDFVTNQAQRSKEFTDTVHTMIEVFQGEENIDEAVKKGKEKSKAQRQE